MIVHHVLIGGLFLHGLLFKCCTTYYFLVLIEERPPFSTSAGNTGASPQP